MNALLRDLNREWASQDWTADGEPYRLGLPIMPATRHNTVDLTRSGSGGSINRLALWRVLRGER